MRTEPNISRENRVTRCEAVSNPTEHSGIILRWGFVSRGSVVVIAYDFESARPGSNPEWGPIYYEASITAQGLPEPSSLR